MLALGHHGDRRAFAAFNRHARALATWRTSPTTRARTSLTGSAASRSCGSLRKADPNNCWEDPDC